MTNVTFPQLIQRGCGIDVHLKVVVATIDGVGIRKETRSFDTFTSCLTEMKEWLLANGITHVAMESTGVYWKPVMRVLEADIPNVWIVNARHIKNVPGHKTDKMDSEWICKLLLAGLLKPSYIPPKEQRQLRDLTRYRNKLIQSIAAEGTNTKGTCYSSGDTELFIMEPIESSVQNIIDLVNVVEEGGILTEGEKLN